MKDHFRRELLIALINSVLAGVMGFVVVLIFMHISGDAQGLLYAFVVGFALMVSMIISALAGVLTPIILRAFKADEKAASGPLISTINDFFALQSYFLIALLIMRVFA